MKAKQPQQGQPYIAPNGWLTVSGWELLNSLYAHIVQLEAEKAALQTDVSALDARITALEP